MRITTVSLEKSNNLKIQKEFTEGLPGGENFLILQNHENGNKTLAEKRRRKEDKCMFHNADEFCLFFSK